MAASEIRSSARVAPRSVTGVDADLVDHVADVGGVRLTAPVQDMSPTVR